MKSVVAVVLACVTLWYWHVMLDYIPLVQPLAGVWDFVLGRRCRERASGSRQIFRATCPAMRAQASLAGPNTGANSQLPSSAKLQVAR